ncbi:unnamed protein product [Caenorhabditis auriculariae]|uniref:Uncharacterized protein n=1 Tax=Caenorhabditis auriculariae TaxID=2777116 RepID=A0A8S1GMU5_9PELO|nr:unnamed protein product [Caenorhabditis auriculariae]
MLDCRVGKRPDYQEAFSKCRTKLLKVECRRRIGLNTRARLQLKPTSVPKRRLIKETPKESREFIERESDDPSFFVANGRCYLFKSPCREL